MKRPKFAPLQIAGHVGALIPLAIIIFDFYTNGLTVNPIKELTLRTGRYALILLILSLACTPLNSVFGWRGVMKLRRPLGLYAFMYAAFHFAIFIGLDYGFDLSLIGDALFEKRYALVGLAAWLMLLALALTSSKWSMKRLGKNWKKLHKLVYPAAGLVIVHFIWLVKADYNRPLTYGAFVAVLLLLRWPVARKWAATQRQRLMQVVKGFPSAKSV